MRTPFRLATIAILHLATTGTIHAAPATAPSTETSSPATSAPAIHVAHDGLRKLSWQMSVPTGTFTDLSIFEVIDLLHGLDFHHLELTPGQRLSTDAADSLTSHNLSTEQTAALMAKLKSVRMDIVSYGPVDLGKDDASARAVFAFARTIKAKLVIATPGVQDLERLDALATEMGVSLAVRGGTEPYAAPEAMSVAITSRSARVVCYDDVAMWKHLGIDPVFATKATGAKVSDVRMQDVNAAGKPVRLGTGTLDYAGVLGELKHSGFKGIVTIGCEPGPKDKVLETFVASVNALSDAITKIAAAN